MKIRRSLLAVLMALVLTVSAVCSGGISAFAEGEASVHVSFTYEEEGRILTAHVKVKSPEINMASGAVFLDFDSMKLECDQNDIMFQGGAAKAGLFHSERNGYIGVAWYNSPPVAAGDSYTEVVQIPFTCNSELSDLTADAFKGCTDSSFLNSSGGYDTYGCAVIDDGSENVSVAANTLTLSFGAIPAAVSGVALNKESVDLIIGQTVQLEAVVTPENAFNKAITWASSDTNIATVSETGLVTAKAEGVANITVTTVSGNQTKTCVVNVEKPPVTITGPKNTQETVSTETGKAPVMPSKITVKYSDGTEGEENVTWDNIETSSYAQAGSFTVNGKIDGYAESIKCLVTVVEEIKITGIVGQYSVDTTVNTAPTLPSKVEVSYSNGSKAQVDVTWEQIAASQYANAGTFVVKGTVAGYDTKAECTVNVKAAQAPTITKIKQSNVTTNPGKAPTMPTKVSVTYNDNTTKELAVTWDSIAATQYAAEGTFTVKGAVAGTDIKAECVVKVVDKESGPDTGESQKDLTMVILLIAVSFAVTIYAAILLYKATTARARRCRR